MVTPDPPTHLLRLIVVRVVVVIVVPRNDAKAKIEVPVVAMPSMMTLMLAMMAMMVTGK